MCGKRTAGPRAWPGHLGPAGGLWPPQPKGSARTWGHSLLGLQSGSDCWGGLALGVTPRVWGGCGHSVPVTWAPPEAPALSCAEFQGAAPVAPREPLGLAGEAGSCRCRGLHVGGGSGCLHVVSCHRPPAPRVAPATLPSGRRRPRAWSRLAVDFLTCRGQCPESLCIHHPHT